MKNLRWIGPLGFLLLLQTADRSPGARAYQATQGTAPNQYQVVDSKEPGGPMFLWNDISTGGFGISQVTFAYPPAGALNNVNDNGFSAPIELGFNFPFFGSTYHTCWISTNGFLSFQDQNIIAGSNTSFPVGAAPNAVVAPFWDDLCSMNTNPDLNVPLTVYRKTDGPIGSKVFIVQWNNSGHKEIEDSAFIATDYDRTTDRYDFQLHLFENGGILFQYKTMNRGGDSTVWHTGTSATIGIENAAGNNGATYLYNGAPSGNAISITGTDLAQLAVGFLPVGVNPPWYVNGGYGGTAGSSQSSEDGSGESEENACGGSVVGSRPRGGMLMVGMIAALMLLGWRRRVELLAKGDLR